MTCGCGHPEDRHGDRPDFVLGCSYEFNPATELAAWRKSNYGVCSCLAFEPLPEPGAPIVFGVHRIPAEAERWQTEPESVREARFRAWAAGALKEEP